jgi:pimeloyl-ACP methyl ester carboxylesterase
MSDVQYVYFHGQPGSPDELSLFHGQDWRNAKMLFVPDRSMEKPDLPLAQYLDELAKTIESRYPTGPIRLVGFSLGGILALEIAGRLIDRGNGRALSLDLISTPAPLNYGNFLPDMAGGMVFSLARTQPWLFNLLTFVQGLMARYAPAFLFNQIFSTASGEDASLGKDAQFRSVLHLILAKSFKGRAWGYRREIFGYAAFDGARLSLIDVPVQIWQGLADNWTPPSMAGSLSAALPRAKVTRLENLSHYSTLKAALPQIFADLL